MDIKSDHKTIRLFLRKEHKQNRQKSVDRTCMRSLGIRKIGHPVKVLKMKPREVVDIMEIYQFCDPCLNRSDFLTSPLLDPCFQIWKRFGNDSPQKLAALAAQLKEYFK